MLPKRPKNFNLDKALDRTIRSLASKCNLCRADYCILLIRRNEIPREVKLRKFWEDMTEPEKAEISSPPNGRWVDSDGRYFLKQKVTKLFDKFEMHSFEDGLCRLFDLEKFGYVIDQMNNQSTDNIYYEWHLPDDFPEQPNAERCIVIGMHKGETIDDTNITPDLIERISNSVMP